MTVTVTVAGSRGEIIRVHPRPGTPRFLGGSRNQWQKSRCREKAADRAVPETWVFTRTNGRACLHGIPSALTCFGNRHGETLFDSGRILGTPVTEVTKADHCQSSSFGADQRFHIRRDWWENEDKMPRTCTICKHPQRLEIERAIVAGTSLRSIAGQFGTAKTNIERHRPHVT